MSSSESPDLERTTESPTLNDSEADVILRSSDGVDFRVRKAVLSEASTFFREMFTLPQGNASSNDIGEEEPAVDELPVVPVAEDQDILHVFLRYVYLTSSK